ncbi:unnamed protein product [Gordionus sp. m RMFG-2023]
MKFFKNLNCFKTRVEDLGDIDHNSIKLDIPDRNLNCFKTTVEDTKDIDIHDSSIKLHNRKCFRTTVKDTGKTPQDSKKLDMLDSAQGKRHGKKELKKLIKSSLQRFNILDNVIYNRQKLEDIATCSIYWPKKVVKEKQDDFFIELELLALRNDKIKVDDLFDLLKSKSNIFSSELIQDIFNNMELSDGIDIDVLTETLKEVPIAENTLKITFLNRIRRSLQIFPFEPEVNESQNTEDNEEEENEAEKIYQRIDIFPNQIQYR